ncbi:MAG: hypothetical protein EP343_09010 [Deltaproteobacteria bacterium]|nr:MAG: hypothetical protein EP343_09010 [Deltaproteobacteria bacterium]
MRMFAVLALASCIGISMLVGSHQVDSAPPVAAAKPTAAATQPVEKRCKDFTTEQLNQGLFRRKNMTLDQQKTLDKSFMITHPKVLTSQEAQTGTWSFPSAMAGLAGNPSQAGEFVKRWLLTWDQAQKANCQEVPARQSIVKTIIEPWKKLDGQASATVAQWKPNLANSPFKLLAIVNRMDLNQIDRNGRVINAGEGRFVYGVMPRDADGNFVAIPAGRAPRMTIILEYRLVANNRYELQSWRNNWLKLSKIPGFDEPFQTALKKITDRFVESVNTPAHVMAGGAPFQLRTNEVALKSPWELREFNLNLKTRQLELVTTKRTPAENYRLAFDPKTGTSPKVLKDRRRLIEYLLLYASDIKKGTHTVPATFQQEPLLASHTQTPFNFSWADHIIESRVPADLKARFNSILKKDGLIQKFSLETCNGCHGGDGLKNDLPFQHVRLRAGQPPKAPFLSEISKFLSDRDLPTRFCKLEKLENDIKALDALDEYQAMVKQRLSYYKAARARYTTRSSATLLQRDKRFASLRRVMTQGQNAAKEAERLHQTMLQRSQHEAKQMVQRIRKLFEDRRRRTH